MANGLRINVGCGPRPTAGWLNLDNSMSVRLARTPFALLPFSAARRKVLEVARRDNVRWATATHLPVADASAEVVYSSHMLEHLDRREARAFLAEAYRALKPGGVLRLALPDVRNHVERYLAHGDADRFIDGVHMGYERPHTLRGWIDYLVVGPRHHLWMYDGKSLSALVERAGFRDVRVLQAGQTTIAEPGPLDLREREEESVYVEARR